MEFKARLRSSYLHQTSWEDLHALTLHWKSDLEFCKDELTFFNHLTDKYFVFLIKEESASQVKKVSNNLLKAEEQQKDISDKIELHLTHLEELIENPFSHDEQHFRDEHSYLENQISIYIQEFRKLKKEIFLISKEALHEERLKKLIVK